jgi:hypothetical protein
LFSKIDTATETVMPRPAGLSPHAAGWSASPETLDHADDPVPAHAGLAVRQVVKLRAEPLDREPHRFRRRGRGNAADQMSTPYPHANPSPETAVISHFLALHHK